MIAVVTAVYGNAGTLRPLVRELSDALGGRPFTVRLVIDASPDASAQVAADIAATDARVRVTSLAANVGQHRALAAGLAAEPDATVWVCLDADLQDPPGAVPLLLDRLAAGGVEAVFAGRRGHYQTGGRQLTGRLHRFVVARLTGLPSDAGAFVALGARARAAVLSGHPPSVVVAVGAARLPVASLPVVRRSRPSGRSAWSSRARVLQSARSIRWLLARRAEDRFSGRSAARAGRSASRAARSAR